METPMSTLCEQQDEASDLNLDLDEIVLALERPSFNIRNYVFAVRSEDFSKCWPFPKKFLDSCLHKDREPQLPPFDPRPNMYQILTDKKQDLNGCNNSVYQKYVKPSSTTTQYQVGVNDQEEPDMLNTMVPELYAQHSIKETQTEGVNDEASPEDKQVHIELKNELERVEINHRTDSRDNHKGETKVLQAAKKASTKHAAELEEHANVNVVSDRVQTESDAVGIELIKPQNLGNLELPEISGKNCDTDKNPQTSCILKCQLLLSGQRLTEDTQPWTGTNLGVDGSAALKIPQEHATKDQSILSCQHLFEERQTWTSTKLGENGCAALKSSQKGTPMEPVNLCSPKNNSAKLSDDQGLIEMNKPDTGKNISDTGPTVTIGDILLPQVCPVCRIFASSSNTALNAHIDHCLEEVPQTDTYQSRPLKHKLKARKKRSMMDICAVAPIRTLEDLERCMGEEWAIDEAMTDRSDISCSFDWRGNGVLRQPRTSLRRGSIDPHREAISREQKEKGQCSVFHLVQEEKHCPNEERAVQCPYIKDSQLNLQGSNEITEKICKPSKARRSCALEAHKKLDASNAVHAVTSLITNKEPESGNFKKMGRPAKFGILTNCKLKQSKMRVPCNGRPETAAHGLSDMDYSLHHVPPSVDKPICDCCRPSASIPEKTIRSDTSESSPELRDVLLHFPSSVTYSKKLHRRLAGKFTVNKRKRVKKKKQQGIPRLKASLGTAADVSKSNRQRSFSSCMEQLECRGIMPIDTSAEEANKLLARMTSAMTGSQQVPQILDLGEASEKLEQACSFKNEPEAAISRENKTSALFSGSNYLSNASKVLKTFCAEACRHQEYRLESGTVKQFQRLNDYKCPLKIKKISSIGTLLDAKGSITFQQPARVCTQEKKRTTNERLQESIEDVSSLETAINNAGHRGTLKRKPLAKVATIANVQRKSKHQKLGLSNSKIYLTGANCNILQHASPKDSSAVSNIPLAEHEMDVGCKICSYPINTVQHENEMLLHGEMKNKKAEENEGKIQALEVPPNAKSNVSILCSKKVRSKAHCADQELSRYGKIRAVKQHASQTVSKSDPTLVLAHESTTNCTVNRESLRGSSTSIRHGGTRFISVTEALKERMQSLSLQKQTLKNSPSLSCSTIPTILNSKSTTYNASICATLGKAAVVPPRIYSKSSNDLEKQSCLASELVDASSPQLHHNLNKVTSKSSCSTGPSSSLALSGYEVRGGMDPFLGKGNDKTILFINQSVQNICEESRDRTDSILLLREEPIQGATEGDAYESSQRRDDANHILLSEGLNKSIDYLNPSTLSELLVSCIPQEVNPQTCIPVSAGRCLEKEQGMSFIHPNRTDTAVYDIASTIGLSNNHMVSQRDRNVASLHNSVLDNISNSKEWQGRLENSKQQLPSMMFDFQSTRQKPEDNYFKDFAGESFKNYIPSTTLAPNNNASYASEFDHSNILPGNLSGNKWLQNLPSVQPTFYLPTSSDLLGKEECSVGLGLTSKLNDFQSVEYNGEHGVVHIFGNPVFKLMGKNVMVSNKDGKPLGQANSHLRDNSGGCFKNANGSRNFNCMENSVEMNISGRNPCCLFQLPSNDPTLSIEKSLPIPSGRWQAEAAFGVTGGHKVSEAEGEPFVSNISSAFGNIENTITVGYLKCGLSDSTSQLLSASGDRSMCYCPNQMSVPSMTSFTRCLEATNVDNSLSNDVCPYSILDRDTCIVPPVDTFIKTNSYSGIANSHEADLLSRSKYHSRSNIMMGLQRMGPEESNNFGFQKQHSGTLSDILQSAVQESQERFWCTVPGTMLART